MNGKNIEDIDEIIKRMKKLERISLSDFLITIPIILGIAFGFVYLLTKIVELIF